MTSSEPLRLQPRLGFALLYNSISNLRYKGRPAGCIARTSGAPVAELDGLAAGCQTEHD